MHKGHFTRETERPRARDHSTSSTLIGGKGGAGPSSLLHTTLDGPTEYMCGREMDVKVYMDSYVASNGSCTMVGWSVFKNHLMALRALVIVVFVYFIMCEDPHE